LKIYIMTDMEGISGIWSDQQTIRGTPQYAEGQKLLAGDVNAAIEGALAGGAAEIVVNDGHGGGPHMLWEQVHPAAKYERPAGVENWLPGMDETFSGAFLIGAHAMAGTQGAFLDHTQTGVWLNYYVNGQPCGETGQMAAGCGHFGVPLLLVAGDDKACAETQRYFPGAETVVVKEGICRKLARCIHPEKAHELIREAAERAMKKVGKVEPWVLKPPIEVVLEVTSTEIADGAEGHPGVERIGPRKLRKMAKNALDIIAF
jgi:D-amino peptidase